MSEAEKQEGQKTVVSFITGLLIGGLLVWVFSSSPETVKAPETEETATEESTTSNDTVENAQVVEVSKENIPAQKISEVGSVKVSDQSAGTVVSLGMTTFPGENGWVVVRDYVDGAQGKILGAARYSVADGLAPTSVELIRPTIKGSIYQVMFYTESGDKKFGTPADTAIEGGETTFKAN